MITDEKVLNKYTGKDNYGNDKKDYLIKIGNMDDTQLFNETKDKIWLSAYTSNNYKSDFHWHCDACYDECVSRGKDNIYIKAYKHFINNN